MHYNRLTTALQQCCCTTNTFIYFYDNLVVMTMFQIGGPVTETFVDRKKELELILNGINKNHYALIGLRRTGKTSLALKVGEIVDDETIVVYIDVSYLTPLSEINFLRAYMNEVIDAYSQKTGQRQLSLRFKSFLDGTKGALVELLKSSHMSVRDTVEIWFESEGERDLTSLVKIALDMPEKLAKEKDVKFLIIIDEFTRLLELKNDDFIWALRSHIHRSKLSHYIISGSALSTMKYLLEDNTSPFYGTLMSITIGGLDDEGVEELISMLKKEISVDTKRYLREITGAHPLYLQAFCYLLSLKKRKKISKKDIDALISEVFRLLTPHFELLFGSLSSFKKDMLTQMAINDFQTAADIAKALDKKPNYINTYLRRLSSEGLLERKAGGIYTFTDKFFKLWIKHNAYQT
jgi:AAA+ ATPase superfamily predicted ATPase